jgi:predicted HicB family RNase H-like nuclease
MSERHTAPHDDMPAEIDFSQGTRGKFGKPGTTLKLPVYLDPDVEAYLTARAAARGVDVNQLVNELLKKDIELIEVAG